MENAIPPHGTSLGNDPADDAESLLADIADAVLRRRAASGWTSARSGFWHRVEPPHWTRRAQGWKLHVSATPLSSPVVLARAAEVLVRRGCPFKFAAGLKEVVLLVSRNYDRGGAGKFITAYPAGDDECAILAEELHRATAGLPGPKILSDRPWRPGSLVHYRYGAFTGVPHLSNDGALEPGLRAPDGTTVADQRQAWFSPPPWAGPPPSPSPEPDREPEPEREPAPPGTTVLLNDRFVVTRALKHSNKGGVYQATDQLTGDEVIIKEARAHVGGALTDTDSRDLLRSEAATLDALAPLGLTPRKVDLFAQGDNLFLAEELLPGTSLRVWVSDLLGRLNHRQDYAHTLGLDAGTAAELAGKVIDLVSAVHGRGFVLRDLSHNNVMVAPDGTLRLIDLEAVAEPGRPVIRAYTPGYGAPEVVFAPDVGPSPERTADLFSLGALVFFLITGIEPDLIQDLPRADARGAHDRLMLLTDTVGHSHPTLRRFAPLLSGLMADEPERRWSLERAREFVRSLPARPVARRTPGDRITPATRDRLLRDGLAHLIATMAGQEAPRLWPPGPLPDDSDPLNVQCGAAGVLAVLVRAAQADPGLCPGLDDAIRRTAHWIDARLRTVPKILPGLYFGRAGTAWALHDAAVHLGEEPLAERALALAHDLPSTWPNPDVCHGAAGAGLTTLHLWQATGEPALAKRALAYADALVETVQRRQEGIFWRIPADFPSGLAGVAHYGFAHGIAGIGTFLLLAGTCLGRPDYVELAAEAGAALAEVAILERGRAWWPSGERPDGRERLTNWCSGSSGVGTFLVRLGLVTEEPRHLELARQAAAAVRQDRWYSLPVACHGLAGNAEFLLDLADATGDARYAGWAGELAAAVHARHALHDGRMVVPDQSLQGVSAGYNTGLAGVLGMLLRLRHGGPRLWLPATPGLRR
ncbi:Serine/threonine-protein kinase C [Nonomuraea coxensis DSM 45129]|uniref:Serine/threonine-protein kinase C n=1 Tax=Nonomuraea coxensis DSM 45129 TaxID=1122611 RepID=A0ABX8TT35_9ACTN|nr:class IV lanthionine synthetase LanL [Nonomuraea coxensis]QYC37932.1 Serine/threonine-protein kinase C [Nonomuraea coxensis DSM 45129]